MNQCHAVSYLFYRINKLETITFTVVSIELRVLDPIAPTRGFFNPVQARGQIAVIPQADPGDQQGSPGGRGDWSPERAGERPEPAAGPGEQRGLRALPRRCGRCGADRAERQKALDEVKAELARVGLLDKETGLVSPQAQERFGYTRTTSLPTPGIIVKGCLDDCDVCEPELHRSIELDLERKALENKLLARQIELLEKSQEYRCCPVGERKTRS